MTTTRSKSLRSPAPPHNVFRGTLLLTVCLLSVSSATGTTAAATRPGIDVWAESGFAPLQGRRVGLITNHTGRTADGRLTLDVLAAAPEIELAAVFAPEHGFEAALEGRVGDAVHGATGLPIHSLYGDTRRPTAEMLRGVEGLVFDIQDIGTRFYTYATTMAYAMEEAAARGIPFVVLDRPNPITGRHVGGPVLDPDRSSFVGYAPIPVRHGMTLGELAAYFDDLRELGVDLTVVPVEGWRRDDWYDATGLAWVDPSPNIRNLTQALLYPAVGPLETTNVSVGRGTDAPFEWLGAPWIESRRLAAALNRAQLPGLRFVPRSLTPTASTHAGRQCGGVNLLVVDREAFDAGLAAATLVTTLRDLYPGSWDPEPLPRLWGDGAIGAQLAAGTGPGAIVASWEPELREFMTRRQRFLLYD